MSKKISLKDKMKKKGEKSYKSRSEGAFTFIGYLDFKGNGVERFKDENKKDYLIDIIPYEIETNKHPNDKKGETAYNMDIWVHKSIGLEKGHYLCMKKTFDEPCKICEKFLESQNQGMEWDDIKHLTPSRRCVYLMRYKKKIYVYDTSFKIFEELWLEVVEKKKKKGEDIFPVYLNEEGCCSLEFSTTDKSGIGRYIQFDFTEIEDYDEKVLEKTISLEKLLIIPDQEKLEKILSGEVSETQDEEETEEDNSEYDDYLEEAEGDEEGTEEEQDEEEEQKEEESVKKKKKKKVEKDECPYNTQFGKDWDEYEHCDTCIKDHKEIYDSCKEKSKGN